MTRTDQDRALPEASSKEPLRPPSGSRSMVFAWGGVLAAGAAVAALAVATFTANNDADVRAQSTSASDRVTHASASVWPAARRTPTCSIWSVPTLEVAPVPQSNLTEGVPYAAMCTEDADDEETTFVFLYGHDTPPARRR